MHACKKSPSQTCYQQRDANACAGQNPFAYDSVLLCNNEVLDNQGFEFLCHFRPLAGGHCFCKNK